MIPFPRQLRVVPIVPFDVGPSPLPGDNPGAVVEHDGRIYDLAGLLRELAPHQLREIGSTAPDHPRSFGTKPCGAGRR